MGLDTGLAGKTALVTGASRGIGRATAMALAAQGANVVLASRRQDALDAVAEEITAAHPAVRVLPLAAHVGDEDAARACVAAAVTEFGGLDVLVNNAGTNPYYGPMTGIGAAQADKTVQVNQYAIVLWTRLAWALSMAERGGAIVNIASVGGLVTEAGIGYYNATKAAVIHLSRQFAMELAPGVRVNCVAPGIVKTHLSKALWEQDEARVAKATPLGRLGDPEDVADAVVFLSGDASRWITGQTLVVDGGVTIRASVI